MKKLIKNNGDVSYILTEKERVSLVGDKVKETLQKKLNKIEKYAECNIDFFTDKEVKEDNKWYFEVEKDGKSYTCIYDNEHMGSYEKEDQELTLLMWRYNDTESNASYVEVIGNYIDNKESVYTVDDTGYNDCEEVEEKYFKSVEEVELNNNNREEVLRNMTGQ